MCKGKFDFYFHNLDNEIFEHLEFNIDSEAAIKTFVESLPSAYKAFHEKEVNASVFFEGAEIFNFSGKIIFNQSRIQYLGSDKWKKDLVFE